MRWKTNYLLAFVVVFSIIGAAFIFSSVWSGIGDSKAQKRIEVAMLADYDSGRGYAANGTVTDVNRSVSVDWSAGAGSSKAYSQTTFVYYYEFPAGDVLYRAKVSVKRQGNVPDLPGYPLRGGTVEILYDPANPARNMPLVWAREIAQTNYNFVLVLVAVIFAGFVTLTLLVFRSKK
jgi:hypothetical protein